MNFGKSFDSYLEVVENKSVTVCPKCGSHNSTNYNFLEHPFCFACGHVEYDKEKKFEYRTIGMMA